ncbi:MAG: glycosyltransferase [Gemmatimonadales bacterium]
MNVIPVTHSYPRWEGDFAGAFIERLVGTLRSRSHLTSVIVPADRGRGGVLHQSGGLVRRVRYGLPGKETLAYSGNMVEAAGSVGGLGLVASLILAQAGAVVSLARERPDPVVHAHWWIPGGIAAWLASSVLPLPYVVTLHGTDVGILERSGLARKIARLVLRRATAVTAVSSYLAERAANICGIDRSTIVVQPMPADTSRFQHLSTGGSGVVSVGRLKAQKRIGLILEAMALLRRRGRELPLKIVGDGPGKNALVHRAEKLGIGDLTEFVGAVDPEAIPAAIGDADVFAFPALHEGFGLAAAEALMLGVPVVAAKDGGGVLDVVPPGGPGRLVDPENPHDLAQAIDQLAVDPNARHLAAERGRQLKQQLRPDRVAATFEHIYARALRRESREVA